MRTLKVTIGGLMVLIVAIAAGFAALHRPTRLWASVWLSATLASLAIAMLGALFRRGPARAFWSGFTLCGWLYLLLSFGPWFQERIGHHLATTAIIELAYPWIAPIEDQAARVMPTPLPRYAAYPPAKVEAVLSSTTPTTPTAPLPTPRQESSQFEVRLDLIQIILGEWIDQDQEMGLLDSDVIPVLFLIVGHFQFCLILAFIGGLIARWFAIREARSSATA